MIFDIIRRTFAVIVLKISGIFVGGIVIEIDTWKIAAVAGIAGIIDVAQELSRSYLADGKIDMNEINRTFGKIADKHKPTDDNTSMIERNPEF